MPFPFTPGLTEPTLVDLSDPSGDMILDGDRGELEAALAAGDVDAAVKAHVRPGELVQVAAGEL